ncbi:MAG: hypothetical protein Q9M91_00615 [Candidatus Dojkabacteria bacterium]|nr:hypothetical protein [Candidatus Dojkabacteria bacterium]
MNDPNIRYTGKDPLTDLEESRTDIPNANMATYAIASSERPAVEGLRGMLNRIVGSLKAKSNMDTKGREWDSAEIAANKGNLWAMILCG